MQSVHSAAQADLCFAVQRHKSQDDYALHNTVNIMHIKCNAYYSARGYHTEGYYAECTIQCILNCMRLPCNTVQRVILQSAECSLS